MSYSNNWKISGVAGLTSLKDCYKSNGDPILQHVGCPRQDTSHTMIDTPEHIITDDGPIKSHTDFRYYVIPNYQINNHNIGAYGHTNLNNQQTDANYIYDRDVEYKADNEYNSAIKWNYDYIPLVMFDNLTQMNDSEVDFVQNSVNGVINMVVNNETVNCLIPSTFYSLYKIEEQLTIESSDVHISSQLYTPFQNNYQTTYPECLSYNVNNGSFYKESFYLTRYADIGFFIKYEYIFKTSIPQLSYSRYYGDPIDTSTWNGNLFSWKKRSIYSIGRGNNNNYEVQLNFNWSGNYWNEITWTDRNDGFEYRPHWNNGNRKNFLYLYEGSGYSSNMNDLVSINHSGNGRGYSKNWRYVDNGENKNYVHSFIVTQDIFIIAPSYKWLFTQSDEIYNYTSTFNEIGKMGAYSPEESKILEARQFNYSGTQTSVSSTSTYNYTTSTMGGYSSAIRSYYYIQKNTNESFSYAYGWQKFDGGSGYTNENIPIATGFYDYSNVLDIPFPYDNTSNSSILDIKISDFIQSDTLYHNGDSLGKKTLTWSSTYFSGFGNYTYRHGIAWPNNTNTPCLYVNFYNHHLMLDPSIHLAAKSSKRNRFAWVAFMTEPVWLEYDASTHSYILRHKYTNLSAEQPVVIDIPINFNGDVRTVRVDFGNSYYNINNDIQGRTLPNNGHVYVGSNLISFKNSSYEIVGFETGYASISGISNVWHTPIMYENQYFDKRTYDDDKPYTQAYRIDEKASKIVCTITRQITGEVINVSKDLVVSDATVLDFFDNTSYGTGFDDYVVYCYVDATENKTWIYGCNSWSDGPSDTEEREFKVQISNVKII